MSLAGDTCIWYLRITKRRNNYMSKIAVLLPKEYMLEQARKVIQEKNADIDILKVIKT